MRLIPFTVSFDALSTLIQITGGVGFQYRCAYAAFLQQHGIDLTSSCPNASVEQMERVALQAVHEQIREDRAGWTRSANPKEMPIGGESDAAVQRFWRAVLTRTFRHSALYEGASPHVVQQVDALWESNAAAVDAFEDYVVFDLFASDKTHSWLPEGLRTLQSLREWNGKRMQLAQTSQKPTLILAAPPFVVTNMDHRVKTVLAQLGAFAEGPDGEPPLLSRVITSRDIGFAKPSPRGIETGVSDLAAAWHGRAGMQSSASSSAVELRRHLHVGDAEADRLACETAGCTYVKCDPAVGTTWELLRHKLDELEASCCQESS